MKTGVALLAFGLLWMAGSGLSGARSRPGDVESTKGDSAPVRRSARDGDARRQAGDSIEGRVRLVAGPRQTVDADEASETVIYFLPAAGAARPAPREFTSVTYTKGFEPSLLVVPVGSTVRFANRDVILHNVFSATPGAAFTLGSYAPGQTRSHTFGRAGLVVVNCSVHRGMRANVLVLETPFSTRARADGSFRLAGLPDGPGTLVLWHPRAAAQAIAWNGRAPLAVDRTLVATRARVGMATH